MRSSLAAAALAAIVAGAVGVGATYLARQAQLADLEDTVSAQQVKIASLASNTASGGGVNVKMMLDPNTGQPTVALEEVFSFDRNHAVCRVDTNPQAFKMATYTMGEVTIEPHTFFMSMVANTIDTYDIETQT